MAAFVNVLLVAVLAVSSVAGVHWDNSAYLDEHFRLLWNVHGSEEITFEMQVRTHGYVGLGFAARGSAEASAGADVVIGWVDGGQTYFQDRHIKKDGHGEPVVDPSQDYALLLAYENATHTVMRFQRKLTTCDAVHDITITNDTMRLIYVYHPDEPRHGSVAPGSLPRADLTIHGVVPLQLTQRHYETDAGKRPEKVRTIELRNTDVPVPAMGKSLKWCRFFEMSEFTEKHHMIQFEPLFDTPESNEYLQKIVLYECQGNSQRLAASVNEGGRVCVNTQSVPCNSVVASWSRGSSGLTFPQEAGFPLDSSKERFYMMATHYHNSMAARDVMDVGTTVDPPTMLDNSGLRLQVTPNLRIHDAGVLSIGMNPEWRHIIPPGHSKVISEGHCLDECTRQTFPAAGISIFAVLMQTQAIGKEVKLRQIREQEDLIPIATDNGVQTGYNEYRQLSPPARVMPGDSMVVECSYDSIDRDSITLGGLTERSESCNVLAVYYPRQKRMTTCHSLPSLPTLLHSLGINKLSMSQPVLISSPAALAGQTLESRLLSYDWAQQFESFQRITLGGSFQAICTDARHKTVSNTDKKEYYRPRVNKMWRSPAPKVPLTCNPLPEDTNELTPPSLDVTSQSQSTLNFEFDSLFSDGRSSTVASPSTILMIVIGTKLFISAFVLTTNILQR